MQSVDHILKNAKIFTATSEKSIDQGAVWIHDGRIRYVGDGAGLPPTPPLAQIHDLSGKFVMPGMTETHAHLSFADASPFAIGVNPVEESTITAVNNARLMLASNRYDLATQVCSAPRTGI